LLGKESFCAVGNEKGGPEKVTRGSVDQSVCLEQNRARFNARKGLRRGRTERSLNGVRQRRFRRTERIDLLSRRRGTNVRVRGRAPQKKKSAWMGPRRGDRREKRGGSQERLLHFASPDPTLP